MKVLVTGCGGDIGQSIGKILNNQEHITLSGCDISNKNAGQFIYTNFFIGLPCNDESYLNFIENYVNKNNIDLIIPIAEPELRFLSKNDILTHIGKAKLLVASKKVLEIGFDKLKTAEFLEQNELPFPKTTLIKNNTPNNFPVILKSRLGSGSADVYLVENIEDFKYLQKKHPDFIIQEYLEETKGEFTCGVFKSKNGITRTIILKRELTGGYSGYGEIIENKDIENVLTTIANKIDLVGSINIQLRLTQKGPVVFEINPRFSSTVLFRDMFGFKDLMWCIEDAFGTEISAYKKPMAGQKFYKGFNEYIK